MSKWIYDNTTKSWQRNPNWISWYDGVEPIGGFDAARKRYESIKPVCERQWNWKWDSARKESYRTDITIGTERDIRPIGPRRYKTRRIAKVSDNEYTYTHWMPAAKHKVISWHSDNTVTFWPMVYISWSDIKVVNRVLPPAIEVVRRYTKLYIHDKRTDQYYHWFPDKPVRFEIKNGRWIPIEVHAEATYALDKAQWKKISALVKPFLEYCQVLLQTLPNPTPSGSWYYGEVRFRNPMADPAEDWQAHCIPGTEEKWYDLCGHYFRRLCRADYNTGYRMQRPTMKQLKAALWRDLKVKARPFKRTKAPIGKPVDNRNRRIVEKQGALW